jgi:hypothetical protein
MSRIAPGNRGGKSKTEAKSISENKAGNRVVICCPLNP